MPWCLQGTAGILTVHGRAAPESSRSHCQLLQTLHGTKTKSLENCGDHIFLIINNCLCLIAHKCQNLATECLPSIQRNAENILEEVLCSYGSVGFLNFIFLAFDFHFFGFLVLPKVCKKGLEHKP